LKQKGMFIFAAIVMITAVIVLSCVPAQQISPTSSLTPTQPTIQSGPQYGGILRVSNFAEGSRIGYPMGSITLFTQHEVSPALETLLRVDKEGKLLPWLASAYKEDAAAKTVTLTLNKGVKFHDGTNFDAQAAKWNLDQYIMEKTPGTENYKSVDVVDDYTIRINLAQWDNTVANNLAYQQGQMISPTAFQKNGKDWVVNNPIGTGPFQFVSWVKDVKATFKKFDQYWQKGKPYLDGVEYHVIADGQTRTLALRGGDIDLALSMAHKDIAGLEKDGFVLSKGPKGVFNLTPDSANPASPFANIKVRQATQYAIDQDAIAKSIYFGIDVPSNQYSYKGHWAYNPTVNGYPYDPAKAKQLLAEAGYANGFKTKINYTVNNALLITAVQGYLKAVGIEVEMVALQQAGLTQIVYQGGNWEGLIWGSPMTNPDAAAYLNSRLAGGNYFKSMAVPDEYLQALRKAITAPDFNGKQKLTQDVMKLIVDKYCMLTFLICDFDLGMGNPRLHDHGFFSTASSGWWTPEAAWIEKK
jgi:peptide/nickel transport system substrate-binding protein